MGKSKKPAPVKHKQFYGRAEWYGESFQSMPQSRRLELLGKKNTEMPCPFFLQVPALGPKSGKTNCNKRGGVCSIRNFQRDGEDISFGPITSTCPNRFIEEGVIVRHIAGLVLGTDDPVIAKEIPFLRRPKDPVAAVAVAATDEEDHEEEVIEEDGEDNAKEDVGRIDLVFAHPEDPKNWCAVEMQAVYFSGAKMADDNAEIKSMGVNANGVPFPGGARRPDFRSSGPKRLMPQLLIKVPTLRRWGKKMVVLIDRPFLDAMDKMEQVDDISNCDIIWVVVRFDETIKPGEATLVIDSTVMTTLEDSVKGLTAGSPTTLSEFELKLQSRRTKVRKPVAPAPLLD
jgi:hypothetical protein